MPPEARLHESSVALDGGSDGLDVLRRVIEEAPRWLRPGGHLVVESSERQAADLADAVVRAGLTALVSYSDDLDATVVVARHSPDAAGHSSDAAGRR
jgi:release factor glutamine methyltransferase